MIDALILRSFAKQSVSKDERFQTRRHPSRRETEVSLLRTRLSVCRLHRPVLPAKADISGERSEEPGSDQTA